MKKVSIIVPVYNVEAFLEKCIISIINQTLKDIEVILINDGSQDNSQVIIDKYQKLYPDIIKTKKIENSGAANARNIGLEMAEGEYIGFVDSDDYIESTMYEKLYQKAKQEEADIVVSGYFVEKGKNIIAYQCGNEKYYGKSIKESPYMYVYGVPYLWNKIFKRDIITQNKMRFSKLRIFEDLEFVYKLYMKANKIAKINEALYYYTKQNETSLTAVFSDKFFDIEKAIKSLKEYSIENECYQELEDILIYTALNHIYIRFNMRVSAKQWKIKLRYINEMFAFWDREFPNWKSHTFYFKRNKKNKEKYISKKYWKRHTFMQTLKLDKLYKMISRNVKRVKNYNKYGSMYMKYYMKSGINDKVVLMDSQHGNDINGNMFYLLKELNDNSEYEDYKIYLGVEERRYEEFERKLHFYKMKHIKLVINGSKKYAKILSSAKYLFTDTSFSPHYIKKEGQIYLNTWHGTPLKTLGKSTKEDFANIANLQKNFVVADYLLYPSEYMMEHMLEDYMLKNIAKNKILLCGYPRNAVFLNEERRKEVKKQLELEGKELIAYMPTWRGTLGKKNTKKYIATLKGYLKYLSENLNENQILYVNVHPYVKDYIEFNQYTNIKPFPKQYETYDFLNICDTLITDYSSVFFDFALTRKKVILFTYDEKEYLKERGLYVELKSLPFPIVYTVEDLLKEINCQEVVKYDEFIEKFCKYDHKDISKRICEKVILNKDVDIKTVDMPKNDKENVLILVRNFADKDINKQFFNLVENMEELKYNYYVGYISRNVRKYAHNLLKLPKGIHYMGQLFSMCNATLKMRGLFKLSNKSKGKIKLTSKRYRRFFKEELKRIYGDIDFKTIILFGEKHEARLSLFSNYEKGKKILYTPNNHKEKYKEMFDYIIEQEEIEKIKSLNEIVELGEKRV